MTISMILFDLKISPFPSYSLLQVDRKLDRVQPVDVDDYARRGSSVYPDRTHQEDLLSPRKKKKFVHLFSMSNKIEFHKNL